MVEAAKGRPMLIVNPNLEDVASSEGTMSVRNGLLVRQQEKCLCCFDGTFMNSRVLFVSIVQFFSFGNRTSI